MLLQRKQLTERRRGVVLLAVLVVVVMLTLAAKHFSKSMTGEFKAAMAYNRAVQARALADSGVNYAALVLSDRTAFTETLNYNPYSNPSAFQVAVGQPYPGIGQGFFSVVAPLGPDESPTDSMSFRYGVTDEAGKINVNGLIKIDSTGQAGVQILMKLGAPEDVANAIMDWVAPVGSARATSAAGSGGYAPKQGPLDTIDELLLVQGMTTDLLYGNDRNRNGILDPDEAASSGGDRNLGLAAYLTVYSREQNVDSSGTARIFVNDTNKIELYPKLVQALGQDSSGQAIAGGQDMAKYIILYRTYGPAAAAASTTQTGTTQTGSTQSGNGGQQQQARETQGNLADLKDEALPLNIFTGSRRRLSAVFELVNTEVVVPSNNPRQPSVRYACPLNSKEAAVAMLPLLFDKLTTSQQQDLAARVNVNTAPSQVLAALPNLTEDDVAKIVENRPSPEELAQPTPELSTPTWLYTKADVSPATLAKLERFITSRTQVYRMQVIGHFQNGGPTARVEAIVDTNRGRPRIVYWRDLSELGRGFAISTPGNNTNP